MLTAGMTVTFISRLIRALGNVLGSLGAAAVTTDTTEGAASAGRGVKISLKFFLCIPTFSGCPMCFLATSCRIGVMTASKVMVSSVTKWNSLFVRAVDVPLTAMGGSYL